MSPLVLVSKVSRIVAMPLDDDCDEKYIRPSRPFMFCSMIWVTESSTTLADAPGYVARISTEGGATVGYIETGRVRIDSAPASKIGRAHVRTPVTNAHPVCRHLLETKKTRTNACTHSK